MGDFLGAEIAGDEDVLTEHIAGIGFRLFFKGLLKAYFW